MTPLPVEDFGTVAFLEEVTPSPLPIVDPTDAGRFPPPTGRVGVADRLGPPPRLRGLAAPLAPPCDAGARGTSGRAQFSSGPSPAITAQRPARACSGPVRPGCGAGGPT